MLTRVVRTAAVAATLTLGVALACSESPFEPRGLGERVPIGIVIEDAVSADSVRRYSFVARSGAEYAVFLEALQGAVSLVVADSAQPVYAQFLTAGPGSPPFDENATQDFGGQDGGVYLLQIGGLPLNSAARFRFRVYEIDLAPERRPARFAIGDTVSGETIDPIVDVDEFLAHGDSGQEIVAVAEAQGSAGSGSVALNVIDPVTNNLLTYVFADAATSNPLTTGRLRLPGTRDYRFTFSSVTSNQYPRYTGPYRFWTYLINRAPEHRAALVRFNSEIGNERIDRAGDVDEFTFQAAAGDEYNAFVQGATRTFQLEIAPQAGGTTLAIATSQPSDTALFAHATNRFQIANAGTYVVRMTATNPNQVADTGAYRFYLYKIDRRPERVPATIVAGDTVTGEDIALPGDVDEFTFIGTAGDEFNAFLQAQNGSPDAALQLDVVDAGGAILGSVQSVGSDTSLLRQPTGRFALPATGTYRLRVAGSQAYGGVPYRGPYRLFLYHVNRRPETMPDTLAFGDSLSGEAIDVPGDVDEFRVTVRASSGANLALELEGVSGELMAQLVDSATGQVVATASASQAGTRGFSGRLLLAPGKYIVRVSAGGYYPERSTLQGSYRLWVYRFGFGPELVSDTFAIGDTVSGEAIDPPGDIDQFHFYGVRGQHVNIALQGLAAPSSGGFQAFITGPTGYSIVFSPTSAAALGDHQTLRVDLPATGWYEIDVSGAGWSGGLAERGPYRFTVEPLGSAPEHVGSALVPGDSVTTEAIDSPGDWDEYTVSASPGQDVGVIVHSTRTDFQYPYLRIFNRTTGDSLVTALYGDHFAGPFRVPASGEVGIAVYQPDGFFRFCYDSTCGGVFSFVGPYAFRVVPINRAPESVPAAYAVGDTVRGEAIYPAGDIDEFTTTAVPGDTLTAYIRLTADPVGVPGQFHGLTLEVIDPTTGNTLAGSLAQFFGQTFNPVGSFAVPAGGGLLIRVRGTGTFGDELTTAPYEFFVKRGQ